MSDKALIITGGNYQILSHGIPNNNKDTRSRIRLYAAWLDQKGWQWFQPDLAAYRDKLLDGGMMGSSVSAHLSTIRAAYRRLLMNNTVRDSLYNFAPGDLSLSDKKAFVDELTTRIENAINPRMAPVRVRTHQDRDARAHVRLSGEEASDLLSQPGVDTLIGLRDTALIAALLCTGVREGEVVGLVVDDLYGSLGTETALYVRHGKGNKSRLVPYGDMIWVLDIIEQWLQTAGIENGPVFRGFYKGAKSIRDTPLTTRAVEYILDDYPIEVKGELTQVKPHDCRRTYARRLYEEGMDLVAIQQNLGHADVKTTLRYIGTLGADRRRAKALYGFDMDKLKKGK